MPSYSGEEGRRRLKEDIAAEYHANGWDVEHDNPVQYLPRPTAVMAVPVALPAIDMNIIAIALREAALIANERAHDALLLSAELPASPGIADTLATVQERAAAIAAGHLFFKLLAPHEPELRALLAQRNTGEAA